ncbi:MAG TPA: ABC transporter permease [Acidimicrobiales bacterium]
MATTATTVNGAQAAPPAIRVAGGTFADDLRAMRMVWKRELIRFFRNRIRIVTSLMQPILFLFVLGSGLGGITEGVTGHFNFKTFMFPGVLSMAVLFTAIFSAISIVWDREFGFLREMLVAPVSRSSIVVGKCLGGATVATFQGLVMLCLAGAVKVPYDPGLLLVLVLELLLVAVALTSFGVMAASRIEQVESFQVVMQFFVLPMFFLSGAVFPLAKLPTWLRALTVIDPLTYGVDPMRRAVFEHLHGVTPATMHLLNPGVSWDGWRVPTLVELAIVALMASVMLGIAIFQFTRPE